MEARGLTFQRDRRYTRLAHLRDFELWPETLEVKRWLGEEVWKEGGWLKESRLMWVTCNVLLVRGGRINYFISETQFSFLRTCLDILLPSFLLFPSQLPAYSRDDLWEGMMNTRVSTCDDEIR